MVTRLRTGVLHVRKNHKWRVEKHLLDFRALDSMLLILPDVAPVPVKPAGREQSGYRFGIHLAYMINIFMPFVNSHSRGEVSGRRGPPESCSVLNVPESAHEREFRLLQFFTKIRCVRKLGHPVVLDYRPVHTPGVPAFNRSQEFVVIGVMID